MNANELADWIKVTEFYNNTANHFINDTMDEVEAMLRKLQTENEMLRNLQLTDEEILDAIKKSDFPLAELSESAVRGMTNFARAILRKAQSK